jgi:hypothetical protein
MPKMMSDIGIVLNKMELTELVRTLGCDGMGNVTYNQITMITAPPMKNEGIKWVKWVNREFHGLDVHGAGRSNCDSGGRVQPEIRRDGWDGDNR